MLDVRLKIKKHNTICGSIHLFYIDATKSVISEIIQAINGELWYNGLTWDELLSFE